MVALPGKEDSPPDTPRPPVLSLEPGVPASVRARCSSVLRDPRGSRPRSWRARSARPGSGFQGFPGLREHRPGGVVWAAGHDASGARRAVRGCRAALSQQGQPPLCACHWNLSTEPALANTAFLFQSCRASGRTSS